MTDSTDTTTPAAPEAAVAEQPKARKGFVARVIGVFFSPGETFEDIRRKPTLLVPILFFYVAMAALFYVIYPVQMADNLAAAEATGRFDSLTSEQIEQQQAIMNSPVARSITTAAAPLAMVVFSLFFALLYWGTGHMLGGEPNYKAMLSMVIFVAMLNPLAHFLIKLPLFLAKGTIVGVTFGPAMFLPDLETTSTTYRALATFDAFNLWSTVVTGIGVSRIAKVSTVVGMTIAIIFFLVGVGIQLGITALFS